MDNVSILFFTAIGVRTKRLYDEGEGQEVAPAGPPAALPCARGVAICETEAVC